MKIAIEGCAHGELDAIYGAMQCLEETENVKIDLLICCGDFQAVRNESDLENLACPPKYRSMNTFWKYYAGIEKAPYPTIFIGGNHEASNHLWELFYGGWVCPNIYFLGFAGVIRFGGVRIAGLSGIFKDYHYRLGHYESQPYSPDDLRSIYHIREYDVYRLKQIQEPVDIFLSHDWPRGIAAHGNEKKLLQKKQYLENELRTNTLGSPPAEELLHHLRPSYWFAAHMHAKFAALVQHQDTSDPNTNNRGVETSPVRKDKSTSTRFLALDKCLPGRDFMQILEIPTEANTPLQFEYDEEWLAITRACNAFLPLHRGRTVYPLRPIDVQSSRAWIGKRLSERGSAVVPSNFVITAPPYEPSTLTPGRNRPGRATAAPRSRHIANPQTLSFLQMLDLPYLLDHSMRGNEASLGPKLLPHSLQGERPAQQKELSILQKSTFSPASPAPAPRALGLSPHQQQVMPFGNNVANPEEIVLDDSDVPLGDGGDKEELKEAAQLHDDDGDDEDDFIPL